MNEVLVGERDEALKALLLRERERVDRTRMNDVRELALHRAQCRGMTVDFDLRHKAP